MPTTTVDRTATTRTSSRAGLMLGLATLGFAR